MPAGAATAASAAGTIGSAALKIGAAGQATKAAKQAQQANLAYINNIQGQNEANLNPTIQGGIRSGNALEGLLGVGGDPAASAKAWDQYRNSTNYNFLFDQGQRATETSNAASLHSGATDKALINYGQGMAGNALQGYESLLSGQQTLGAQSAANLGQLGLTAAGQVANTNNAAAGVKGSAAVYGANAEGSALQGLSSLANKNATASSFGSDALSQGTANLGNGYVFNPNMSFGGP